MRSSWQTTELWIPCSFTPQLSSLLNRLCLRCYDFLNAKLKKLTPSSNIYGCHIKKKSERLMLEADTWAFLSEHHRMLFGWNTSVATSWVFTSSLSLSHMWCLILFSCLTVPSLTECLLIVFFFFTRWVFNKKHFFCYYFWGKKWERIHWFVSEVLQCRLAIGHFFKNKCNAHNWASRLWVLLAQTVHTH